MSDISVTPVVDESEALCAEKAGTELVSEGLETLHIDEDAKNKKFNTIKWLHFGAAIFFLNKLLHNAL